MKYWSFNWQNHKYQSIFSQFSESPVHFHCQSLKHGITISSELELQTLSINRSVHETFPHWEKKMIRKIKKTARFLTAQSSASPVRRFQGVLVKAVGNRSHMRKRPTSIVRFERAYLNCNSFWDDNTFGKNTVLRDWPVSPRTRGDNSADLLWKALVSRRCISCTASWLSLNAWLLMESGAF